MNQMMIGSYIARKRKEINLAQEKLAEQLGVSNKTVSKWENGKCMPDYSVIQKLCDVLHISLVELMDGSDGVKDCNEQQMLALLRRTQELEKQKNILYGLVFVVLGIASTTNTTGGSDVQAFVSGLLMSLSVVEILSGIFMIGKQVLF